MSGKDIHDLKFYAENYGDVLLDQSNKAIAGFLIFAHKHHNIFLHRDILGPKSKTVKITVLLLLICRSFRFGFNEREL